LVCGLGNSPPEYHLTRHNAGFLALDEIVHTHSLEATSTKLRGNIYRGKILRKPVVAFYPETLMNNCGQDIANVVRFYGIPLKNLMVLHDDVDLPQGSMRVKIGGSSAGHNGIKSIDNHLGADYLRIRIGIGRGRGKELNKHVLGKFNASETKVMKPVFSTIAERIELLLEGKKQEFLL